MSANLIHAVIEIVVGGTIIYDATNKQNKLVAGTLVELIDNTNSTTTINVKSDSKKQNKLVPLDDTIILEEKSDGTTGIKGVFTESIQVDNVGGTKKLTVTERIVSVTAGSRVSYNAFESEYNTFILVNNTPDIVSIVLDETTHGDSKIIKNSIVPFITLPPKGTAQFVKFSDGWQITNLFGVSYSQSLAQAGRTDKHAVTVGELGTLDVEKILPIEIVDESQSSELTGVQLNTRYPEVAVGFMYVCPAINRIYKKYNDLGEWIVYNTEKV